MALNFKISGRNGRWLVGVGMEATEEVRDTEIGEQDKGEGYNAEDVVEDG